MIKISPSILSCDFSRLEQEAKAVLDAGEHFHRVVGHVLDFLSHRNQRDGRRFVGGEIREREGVNGRNLFGEILDDYHDGATEDDKRGILDLFTKLTGELMDEGFLGDLIQSLQEEAAEEPKLPKVPQDHKKPQK